MKYQNARDILSPELFQKLQAEVGGKLLYIPAGGERRDWGELSGGKSHFSERNQLIFKEYAAGKSVKDLAEEWFLSVDSIRKIISTEKSRCPVHYLGIDIGGTNIKFGVADSGDTLISYDRVPTPKTEKELINALYGIIDRTRQNDPYIMGIGVSSAGNIENGATVYAFNLPFKGTPLKDVLENFSHLPVQLENDANCAALGEYTYAANEKELVYLSIGTGIGSGLILNGQLYKGRLGLAGEAGHITLVYGGKPCGCGRRGCFEQYASVTALIEQTKEAIAANPTSILAEEWQYEGRVSGELPFVAAAKGCVVAQDVIRQYTGYLAAGIDSLCELLDPKRVVLAGAIVHQGSALLNPLCEQMKNKSVIVSVATNAGLSGVIGATRLFTGGRK